MFSLFLCLCTFANQQKLSFDAHHLPIILLSHIRPQYTDTFLSAYNFYRSIHELLRERRCWCCFGCRGQGWVVMEICEEWPTPLLDVWMTPLSLWLDILPRKLIDKDCPPKSDLLLCLHITVFGSLKEANGKWHGFVQYNTCSLLANLIGLLLVLHNACLFMYNLDMKLMC